jgi:hypothetical protein
MDVMLSDLGYKIPYGVSRDLLAPNSGLKPEKVEESRVGGSISKRIKQKFLLEMRGIPQPLPPRLTVAEPANVTFPGRMKTLIVEKQPELSESIAKKITMDDDEFLRQMELEYVNEEGESVKPSVLAPDKPDIKKESGE